MIHFSDGTELGPIVPRSAWEQLRIRLEGWNSTTSDWQAGISRALLTFTEDRPALPTGDLLQAAIQIGDRLEETAAHFGEDVSWISLHYGAGSQRVYPMQANSWGSDGTAGVCLFLAELARVSGEHRFEELARKGLQSAERTFFHLRRSCWKDITGLSGFHGAFFLVYALTRAGIALCDDSLLDTAVGVALDFDESEFHKEKEPDFLVGHAGVLTVLAQLYRHRPDARLAALGRISVKMIEQAACSGGAEGWQATFSDRPLLGFGHGSSGVAMGLLLSEPMLRHDATDQVRAAFAHERRFIDPRTKRWPNLQRQDGHSMHGWCSGQAGIGMARLLALRQMGKRLDGDHDAIQAEMEAALSTCTADLHTAGRHLCCGDAGVMLLQAGIARALNRPELLAQAQQAARTMLEHRKQQGTWRLQEFTESMPIPGLMGGIAGIGLTLLSLIDPQTSEFLTLC